MALGKKDLVPMGLLPLVTVVARPVKHARLTTALLRANALMRSMVQNVPLHATSNNSGAETSSANRWAPRRWAEGRGSNLCCSLISGFLPLFLLFIFFLPF